LAKAGWTLVVEDRSPELGFATCDIWCLTHHLSGNAASEGIPLSSSGLAEDIDIDKGEVSVVYRVGQYGVDGLLPLSITDWGPRTAVS